ncbi:MAG: nicotinate (nicotinamide) nucleotide adenylyltransferase [Bacilli bacterium]|nr:nicotinate (nicotinamide) nucleotide adenylyltransferase [Bacilli bacterium]
MIILLYGGSFNPPTVAHYLVARHLLLKYPKAELHFLPTNNFYPKDNLKDYQYRYEMLEILCRRLGSRAKVNDFELHLDKYYGTYYTLEHFPNAYFIIGADNLLNIDTWINYPMVIEKNKFIILPRNNIDIEAIIEKSPTLKANRDNFIIIENFSSVDISSSQYRQTKNIKYLLPEVAKYIKDNNLFKE